MFQSWDIESMVQKIDPSAAFHISPKCDNVYKLCLWLQEEHICLVLTPLLVLRLRYRACAWKYEPLLPGAESLKRDKIKIICL